MARAPGVPFPTRGRAAVPRPLIGAGIIAIVIGILGVTGVLAQVRPLIPWLREAGPTYQTATVGRGTIEVSVVATGPVAAVESVPLGFKTSGRLASLNVQVGDRVARGQVLATLDPTDLQTAVDQAQATLTQAQANLAKLEAGATPAQRQVAQAAVDSAKTAAANAQAALATTKSSVARDIAAARASVSSAQINVDAARAALAAAQQQEKTGLAADQTNVANAQKNLDAVKASVAAGLAVAQQQLARAKDDLWSAQISRDAICGRSKGADCQAANASVASAQTGVDSAQAQLNQQQVQGAQQIQQAQAQLAQAQAQLASDQAKLAAAVQSAQSQLKQAQQSLQSAQIGVSQAEAKATATVQSAQAQVDQAQGSLRSAEANYNATIAPPTPADLQAARAQVANAQAALAQAQANLAAAKLTAPIDGTVAAISGTVGQWVAGGASTAVITLIDPNQLQVTAQVNEADIGKVKVGDPVTFTVSAYPDKSFSGKVLTIQPQGTVVQNVVNYNVTCSIQSTGDATLYPGMTAAASIVSARHPDVLVVPNTALSFAQTAIRDGLVELGGRRTGQNGPAGRNASGAAGGNTRGTGPNASGSRATSTGGFRAANGGAGQTQGAANRGIVLTLKDGKLTPVPVTLGITDGARTEVVSGLQEGDVVVVGASGVTVTRGSSNAGGPRPNGPPVGPFGGGFRD